MKDPKKFAEEMARQTRENIAGVADNMAGGVIGRAVLRMRARGEELTWDALRSELETGTGADALDASWYRAALKAIED